MDFAAMDFENKARRHAIIQPSAYKLTIDMVPECAWGHNLRELIPASQWDRIKEAVFEVAKHRCVICGGRGWKHPVECHEDWIFDVPSRLQILKGLLALCPDCHGAKHLGFTMKMRQPKTYERVRAHMMRVNGIDATHLDIYIARELASQRAMRNMRFVMDLAWLEKHFVFSWSKKGRESTALIRGAV